MNTPSYDFVRGTIHRILDDTAQPYILRGALGQKGAVMAPEVVGYLKQWERDGYLEILGDLDQMDQTQSAVRMLSYIGKKSPIPGFLNWDGEATPASMRQPRVTYYLVGIMKDPLGSRPAWEGMHILLRERDFSLALCAGPGPHDEGSVAEIASWLEQRPFTRWFYSERVASGIEEPGWLERECVSAGCGWFVPFARRIASREKVSLEEITAAYSAHNDGLAMPHGTIDELFGKA